MWWILITCSKDYYTLYNDTRVICAESADDAVEKAGVSGTAWVELVFGPFNEEPKPVSLSAADYEDPDLKVYN